MVTFALNVRRSQLSLDQQALRVSRQNLYRAVRLIGRSVFLYRPRDEEDDGYYGMATIANVEMSSDSRNFIWIELSGVKPFPKTVTLDELYGLVQIKDTPFHTYSRALRPVSAYESDMLLDIPWVRGAMELREETGQLESENAPVELWSFRRQSIKRHLLRAEMLTLYGNKCVFTEKVFLCLNGRLAETQVGHLIAREYGGPDIIQNVLPMSSVTNWHWDHGLISLTNSGKLLVATKASSETRLSFLAGLQLRFADSRFWPRAEYLEWHRDNIFEKGRQRGLIWSTTQRSRMAAARILI
ncbi:hypothetical protein WH87_02890 [Devosia epidermidihirudinis]|uniref:HNH nuclease domain-containing protein n=1 Tax=Devosia epidermidihirudinis TaxID=1293439 RepID=A0A0F5QJ49_9HYPH|nr:hypothetical protein [Devosia epidermidihirudinis]KKC40761.1 hypothetical protein WH87_02890 [Devosia epidermidihirudinis]